MRKFSARRGFCPHFSALQNAPAGEKSELVFRQLAQMLHAPQPRQTPAEQASVPQPNTPQKDPLLLDATLADCAMRHDAAVQRILRQEREGSEYLACQSASERHAQSIGDKPFACKNALADEKCLHSKKP